MTRYLLRRALQGLFTLWLMLTAAFFLTQLFLPGDYVSQFSIGLDGTARDALRAQLGLDRPVGQRYLLWLGNALTLDLGRSYAFGGLGEPVTGIIRRSGQATLLVFVPGLVIAFLIGQTLGRISAWKGRSLSMDVTAFTLIAFYAFFPPSLAFFLRAAEFALRGSGVAYGGSPVVQLDRFSVQLPPFVTPMLVGLGIAVGVVLALEVARARLARFRVTPVGYVPVVLGLWAATWAVFGIWPQVTDRLAWFGLPIIAFVLLTTGEMMVLMRTAMADTRHEEYIATAKAKGLKPAAIRDRHAARNALLPVLSRLVVSLPYLLAGLAFIEYALNWPGMGFTLFQAVLFQNVPVFQGMLIVIGGLTLISRLILDILYALLDPRIRHAAAAAS